jgi:hypothetical protein
MSDGKRADECRQLAATVLSAVCVVVAIENCAQVTWQMNKTNPKYLN